MAAYGATHGLSPRVTTIEEPDEESTVLRMAARGFHLFPVEASGKQPLIREWPKKATCDAEKRVAAPVFRLQLGSRVRP